MLSRRSLLQGAAALTVSSWPCGALAQETPVPIVFVHGDSDLAATWQTVVLALREQRLPARPAVRHQLHRSAGARRRHASPSPTAPRRRTNCVELDRVYRQGADETGAEQIALVALSRGGYSVRNYIARARVRQPCVLVRHAQPRGVRDRRAARERIQRSRRVPEQTGRRRQRDDARGPLPHVAERRLRPLRPALRRLYRTPGHADQRRPRKGPS